MARKKDDRAQVVIRLDADTAALIDMDVADYNKDPRTLVPATRADIIKIAIRDRYKE